MIYILFLLMFLTITLKWLVYSCLTIIWNFTIPYSDIKKEFNELFDIIKKYRT